MSLDIEVLVYLIKCSYIGDFVEDLKVVLNKVKGGFVYMFLMEDMMYVVFDLNGFRLFLIGCIGDFYVVVLEICVFEMVGVEFVCDVELGELIIINDDGFWIEKFMENVMYLICSMEYIYFVWFDFNIVGINVYLVRKCFGKRLVKEVFIDVDVVIGVLDFSIFVVIGYVEEVGFFYEFGFIKNRYVVRIFI